MSSVQIKQLHKSYKNNKVLKGIDLDINKGGIWAILGPNASGKTTLIKNILGMVLPDSGQILIDENDVSNQWEYKSNLNYLPQIAHFPDNLTISELFKMIEELRGNKGDKESLINKFELKPHLDKKLSNLSGGTKQKVNLTISLMYDNPIYILDEPTASLDPVALIELKKILTDLKAQNKMVIFTTHIISLVEELADYIVFLLEGEIRFNGTTKQLNKIYKSRSLEKSIASLLSDKSETDE